MPTPETPSLPRALYVLVAASFIIAVGYGFIAPILPVYASTFGVGATAASLVISAFSFMRLVTAPFAGRLVERLGERSIYLTGLLLVALSTGAAGLADSYLQLLVLRGLGGVGSSMFTISALGLIVRLAPPTLRGRASALYGSAFLIGNVVGPVLGGALLQFGYRVPFFAYAGALLVATAVVAVLVRGAGQRPAPGAPEQPPMPVSDALRHPTYRASLVTAFANGWTNFGVRLATIPLLAAAVPAIGASMGAVALTVFALGNAVSLQLAGRLVDGRGRKLPLQLGVLIAGGATLVFGFSEHVVPFLVLSAIAGVGAGLLAPAMQASVADVIGGERSGGRVLSRFQMTQDLGAILGPLAAGLLIDSVGFVPAFAVAGVILLVSVLPWRRAPETHPGR